MPVLLGQPGLGRGTMWMRLADTYGPGQHSVIWSHAYRYMCDIVSIWCCYLQLGEWMDTLQDNAMLCGNHPK